MSAGEQTATDSLVDSVHPTLPRWATRSSKERASLPESVGRYRIGRRLGQGGAGTVHVAHDDELDREVAIKFVPCGARDDVGARVLREARALARLSHPNIVHVYDYGRHEDYVHIVMELVAGDTLGQWLDEPSSWMHRLELFVAIGEGLAAAHAAGVVHRDFKPSNVIVGEDGRPRILDLGLARLTAEPDVSMSSRVRNVDGDDSDEATTREGAVMGTPKFMSPEQWAGQTVDARTDQFSFCLCLFGAVYGQPPFSMEAVMLGASDGEAPPLEVPAGTRVPVALRRALSRGLAFDPEQRWPSMDALVAELRPLLRRRRWVAVGLVGLVAVAAGAGYGMRVDPSAACEQASAGTPDWAGMRASVADRFAETKLAYASDSFAFVDERMESFVGSWTEQAQSGCLARARGELTGEAAELRTACLAAQAERFERTVDVLGELDAESVRRSAEIVRGLPRPVACEEPGLVLEPAIRAAIDRADLLRRAARYDDALAALEQQAPLPAEALRVRGRIAEDRGEPTKAAEDLRAAFARAEAEQRDALAAEVATDLVRVYGYRLGRAEAAEALVLTAQAKVDRVAPERDPMRADLAAVLGRYALGRGKPAEAAEHLARAVEMRDEADALGLAADLNLRAQAQAMLREYEAANAGLLRALEIRTDALGPTHPLVGSNRLNLGHVCSMRGDAEAAMEHFRAAKDILERALGPEHPQTAAVALALASELSGTEHFAEAEAELRRAIAVYDGRAMTTDAAKARNTLALQLIEHERFDDALREIEIGVAAVQEALGSTSSHMADLEFNAGLALSEKGQTENALARIERAAEIDASVFGPDSGECRKDLAFAATLLNRLERHAQAVALVAPWLEQAQDVSSQGDAVRAVAEYAWAQLQLGQRDQAKSVLERWRPALEEAHGPDALAKLREHFPEVWRG